MSHKFSWSCPYCNQHATITDNNFSQENHIFHKDNVYGSLAIQTTVVVCPNVKCKEYVIKGNLYKVEYVGPYKHHPVIEGESIISWNMKPSSHAKVFPSYIPKPILTDYQEACAIRDLSPKASATLARRCLQGMIRDYWKIKNGDNLFGEINMIEDKVEPSIFKAIDAVRRVGNIGAHMEKDINLIIEVDPNEAQLLIELIETLFKEWYVARNEREDRLNSIIQMADSKKEQKKKMQ